MNGRTFWNCACSRASSSGSGRPDPLPLSLPRPYEPPHRPRRSHPTAERVDVVLSEAARRLLGCRVRVWRDVPHRSHGHVVDASQLVQADQAAATPLVGLEGLAVDPLSQRRRSPQARAARLRRPDGLRGAADVSEAHPRSADAGRADAPCRPVLDRPAAVAGRGAAGAPGRAGAPEWAKRRSGPLGRSTLQLVTTSDRPARTHCSRARDGPAQRARSRHGPGGRTRGS